MRFRPDAVKALAAVAAVVVAALLAACTTAPSGDAAVKLRGASALPDVQHPADNPPAAQKIALGRQSFFDTRLSGSGRNSRQSCHFHHLGWTDGKALSVRDNGDLNTRHTPALYNVGYQSVWYWDGRAATLEAQVLAAWRNQMSVDPAVAAARVAAVPGYASQFQAVYGAPASADLVVRSLAAYLRTKNSTGSAWDRFESGDTRAVSAQAIEGHKLFTGKGRCSQCHAPPFYGNSTFFNIGLEHGKDKPDAGRFTVSKAEADRGAFKTPTLRSVARGAPYFHDGSAATLKDAVRYMAGGGKPDPARSPLMQPTGLSEAEIDQVVAFLEALSSTETWQMPSLP